MARTVSSCWLSPGRLIAPGRREGALPTKCSLLGALLGLGACAALDAAGRGAVDVVHGDPALVEGALVGAAGRALAARHGLLVDDHGNLLGGLGALGLGEEGGDVGVVDKVAKASESTAEDQVQEDTVGEGEASAWGGRLSQA